MANTKKILFILLLTFVFNSITNAQPILTRDNVLSVNSVLKLGIAKDYTVVDTSLQGEI